VILEVEPIRPPTLNIFSHRELEVVNFLSNHEANSSNNVRAASSAVALDKEYLPAQTLVGSMPRKASQIVMKFDK
jgi:hypothetical protein